MKITVMGMVIVLGGVLVIAVLMYSIGQNWNDTGKNDDQSKPIN